MEVNLNGNKNLNHLPIEILNLIEKNLGYNDILELRRCSRVSSQIFGGSIFNYTFKKKCTKFSLIYSFN